jgi:hypothetical protein
MSDIDKEDLEILADKTHSIWAKWMRYFITKFPKEFCKKSKTVSIVVPLKVYNRWIRQIEQPYRRLTEKEKESDRLVAKEVFVDD